MSCTSPSTNPSSCESIIANSYGQIRPSTSTDATTQACQFTNGNSSSPAIAQSVPPYMEPQYPEPSGRDFFITSRQLNQALSDIEERKVGSLQEWKARLLEEKRSAQGTPPIQQESKPQKRKASDLTNEDISSKKPAFENPMSNNPQPASTSEEENPLKRMEMMTNSTVFKAAPSIREVVVDPSEKRDDKTAKLEKLGGIARDLESENAKMMMMARHQQMMARSPMYPQMFPSGTQPFPPGAMGRMPIPNGPFPYPMGHPGMPGMPPMYPGMPGRPQPMSPFPMPGRMPPHMTMDMKNNPSFLSPNHPEFNRLMHMNPYTNPGMLPLPDGRSPSFGPPPMRLSYPGMLPMYPGMSPHVGPTPMPLPSPVVGSNPMPPGPPSTTFPRPMSGPMPQPQSAAPSPMPIGGPRSQPPAAVNSPFFPPGGPGSVGPTMSFNPPMGPAHPGMLMMNRDDPTNAGLMIPPQGPFNSWPRQLSDPNALPSISMPTLPCQPPVYNTEAAA